MAQAEVQAGALGEALGGEGQGIEGDGDRADGVGVARQSAPQFGEGAGERDAERAFRQGDADGLAAPLAAEGVVGDRLEIDRGAGERMGGQVARRLAAPGAARAGRQGQR